jgi:hypothetical protein
MSITKFINLVENNLDKINWSRLSMNSNAISLLEKNEDKIDLVWLSLKNRDEIDKILLVNRNIVENTNDRREPRWDSLSLVCSVNETSLLEKNQNKINWNYLSSNQNGISLLERNQDKINWSFLSSNPGIFELDYKFLENRIKIYKEELMMTVFHPRRFNKYLEMGYNMGDDTYEQDVKEI